LLHVTAVQIPRHPRVNPFWALGLAVLVLGAIPCPAAAAADKKDKDTKKNEKVEPWVEVRTPHFTVMSDGGEKTARRVADQFELVRRVFQATMPGAHLDTGIPIEILAAKDGKSFATLFPEYPFDKRHEQPFGAFLSGTEKNYIALRTNVNGPVPYEDIYHEYARLVLKLSYHSLPPWLEGGYANVYGSMTLTDKGARIGRPDHEDLAALWRSPLLPLDLVIHVDRASAYYNSGGETTVYSAESRAFVHYLLTDAQASGIKSLEQYIAQVEGGADALQAARQVFGDLNQLQGRLEAYIKETTSPPTEILAGGGSESVSSPRTLTPAETEARIGELDLSHGRRDDARTKLEDALMLDPSLASAEESLGFLLLQTDQLEEAEKHFLRAAELDPKRPLAFYGQGMVAMSRGGSVGVPVGAVVAFEKTIELSPDFAPAWYNLASIYSLRKETLPKALDAAQHAASLVPGDAGYQYQVAVILQNLGRTEEARKAAERIRNSSSDLKSADKAGDLIAQMSQPHSAAAPSSAPPVPATVAPPEASTDREVHIERKTEPDDKPAETPSSRTREPAPPPPAPAALPAAPAEARIYSMVGTITDVSCADAPQIQITLKAQTIVMRLHAADAAHLTIKPSGTASPAKSAVCPGLRGRSARVTYQLVSEKKWDGEIQTVELRDLP
jgi:tetratricopeptide (TPR) repeat protein